MPATTDAAPFSRVPAKTALEICKAYTPGQKALELLGADLAPRPYFDLLVKKELWVEAGRFLAQALPKREAVWWACTCVRQGAGPTIPSADANALAAAEKWVAGPTEENRRAAHAVAEAAQGMETPAGCAAMAAFWSGGSLAAPDKPAVPPAENLTGTAVTGALIQAAALNEPDKFTEKMRLFLNVGVNTATGSNRWKEAAGAATR
jgi:Family of unknown function (DUF6931)